MHVRSVPKWSYVLSTIRLGPFLRFFGTAPTELYTLSLHDALPICRLASASLASARSISSEVSITDLGTVTKSVIDRKSTRLNSSHVKSSYAVFGLKKKEVAVWLLSARVDGIVHGGLSLMIGGGDHC